MSGYPTRELTEITEKSKADVKSLSAQSEAVAARAWRRPGRTRSYPYVFQAALADATPSGTTTVDLPFSKPEGCSCVIRQISVAYRTLPASSGGTILIEAFRLRSGADPESLFVAAVSVEDDNLTAAIWKKIDLTNAIHGLHVHDGDFFYVTITSTAAIQTIGTGGGISFSCFLS